MVNGKWTVQYYQSIGVPIGGQRDTEGEFGKHLELCENNKNMTLPSVPVPCHLSRANLNDDTLSTRSCLWVSR